MCPISPYHKAVIDGAAITVSHMPLDELKQAPGTPALLSDPSVMIVEDDHDVANTIRRFIERIGMKTCWARNGSEAVRLKESFQPEIVLVDLELPDVSGVSLISWLAGQRDCGIIVVSGRGDEVERVVSTAVRELGTNAIEWGHRKESERIVTVDYRIDPEKITIDIKDTGPGFDPDHLAHAAHLEDPVSHMMVRETLGMREGGFGILMSRGLVDNMSYNDKGNEVRLIKYFGDVPLRSEDGRVISASK